MDNVSKYHDNYDFVLKEVLSLYTNQSLEFLGIDAKVKELLNTENVEVEIRKSINDQVLKLDTNTGLDLEWEADVSSDDLLRFAGYCIALTRKYKMPFTTIIVTRKKVKKKSYIGGSIKFTPRIINLNERDGVAALNDIRKKLDMGISVNPLEVMYVPLYNNFGVSYENVYKTIIELMPKIMPDKDEQDKLLILSVLLANKLVPENEYQKILGATKVALANNNLFKILEDERDRETAKRLLELGVSVDIVKKALGLTDADIDAIQKEAVAVNS